MFSNSLEIVELKVFKDLSSTKLKKVNVSTEVKNYLLDGSPRADFTLLMPEDIIAKRTTKAAKDLIFKLQVHLEQSQNAMVDEEQNAKVENQLQIETNMAHIDNCWGGLSNQIIQGTEKIDDIIFELRGIKNLLVKLPASYRAEIQQCFSSLCAEADIVILATIRTTYLLALQAKLFSLAHVAGYKSVEKVHTPVLKFLVRLVAYLPSDICRLVAV
ncbi:hypothetical protein Tco_1506491 [Tanacetum coccineum]